MILQNNFETRIVLLRELPCKDYYSVKIILRSHRSLSSVQDSVHGFITQLQKGIF